MKRFFLLVLFVFPLLLGSCREEAPPTGGEKSPSSVSILSYASNYAELSDMEADSATFYQIKLLPGDSTTVYDDSYEDYYGPLTPERHTFDHSIRILFAPKLSSEGYVEIAVSNPGIFGLFTYCTLEEEKHLRRDEWHEVTADILTVTEPIYFSVNFARYDWAVGSDSGYPDRLKESIRQAMAPQSILYEDVYPDCDPRCYGASWKLFSTSVEFTLYDRRDDSITALAWGQLDIQSRTITNPSIDLNLYPRKDLSPCWTVTFAEYEEYAG